MNTAYYRPLLSLPRAPGRAALPDRDPVHQVSLGGLRGGPAVPAGPRVGAPARHQVQPPLLRRPTHTGGYELWLHQLAVRFVAVPDAPLDYSAVAERALIDRGLPYLRLVWRSRHWRVYAVRNPTPIVQGAARLDQLGPNSLLLTATRPGSALIRVHFTPYWKLTAGTGCVAPAGRFTELTVRRCRHDPHEHQLFAGPDQSHLAAM